jgi:orotate phosphoribosyltransferase
MKQDEVLEHFRASGALLNGHYLLSSGLHSSEYLQCALALQYTADALRFGNAIADQYRDSLVGTVASPAIGGLVIGFAAAAALNVRFIWTEREAGRMTLRRGFTVRPGEKILVVEDVITTGGSTRECISALAEAGGKVVGAASIIDRSGGQADVGVSRVSLATLDVPTYPEADCPMCARGETLMKPGSRTLT